MTLTNISGCILEEGAEENTATLYQPEGTAITLTGFASAVDSDGNDLGVRNEWVTGEANPGDPILFSVPSIVILSVRSPSSLSSAVTPFIDGNDLGVRNEWVTGEANPGDPNIQVIKFSAEDANGLETIVLNLLFYFYSY